MRRVSILVVVDGTLKQEMHYFSLICGKSFNPCCCGWNAEAEVPRITAKAAKQVSILVVVDGTLKPDIDVDESPGKVQVSILVVVDGTLKPDADILPLCAMLGFNPCCCGWNAEAGLPDHCWAVVVIVSILVVVDGTLKQDEVILACRTRGKVSILVVVDGTLKHDRQYPIRSRAMWFQSLLLWMER